MKSTQLLSVTVVLLAGSTSFAQQASRALGAVESIDPANGQIALKTDQGLVVRVTPAPGARFVRVPPGETSLSKAIPIQAVDISIGDRLLARGEISEDKTSLSANLLVVMTKADLAKKHEADRAEWQKRGVGGLVSEVNPATGEITITTRTFEGPKPLVVVVGPRTAVRRYAPDSVKFAEAKPSTVAEIEKGDQVRALGDKSADGTRFTAEEVVSGSFRNVAATVSAVDLAAGTLKVTDLATKKPLTVHVNADSTMRKLPDMVARMMAMRVNGGPGAAAGGPPGAGAHAGAPPQAGPPQAPPPGANGMGGPGGGPPGAMRGGRSGDLRQMLKTHARSEIRGPESG
ncbi:MAG: hypothetical protein U0Q18_03430 [Bryobacteraceae bacterium]